MSDQSGASSDIVQRADRLGWYHTLELAPGYLTPGMFDLRDQIDHYRLPERLDGQRVLEIGTWDGFWAFELERRGAAEVVALDLDDEAELDWPPRRRPSRFPDQPRGEGFRLAREALGSDVQRVVRSIYDATPQELGSFDLVFCGSVLIHLRDQLLALERIAALCSGTLICAEEYDPWTGMLPFPVSRYLVDRDSAVVFWLPSIRTWKRMLWSAGFDRVEQVDRFRLRSVREGFSVRHVVLHAHRGGSQMPATPSSRYSEA